MCRIMSQCVAMCCSVVQRAIRSHSSRMRCSVLQCVAVCCSVFPRAQYVLTPQECIGMCCSVLQRCAARNQVQLLKNARCSDAFTLASTHARQTCQKRPVCTKRATEKKRVHMKKKSMCLKKASCQMQPSPSPSKGKKISHSQRQNEQQTIHHRVAAIRRYISRSQQKTRSLFNKLGKIKSLFTRCPVLAEFFSQKSPRYNRPTFEVFNKNQNCWSLITKSPILIRLLEHATNVSYLRF